MNNFNPVQLRLSLTAGTQRPLAGFALVALLASAGPVAEADDLTSIVLQARSKDPAYLAAEHRFRSDSESYKQARSQLMPNVSWQYEEKNTDQNIVETENEVFRQGGDDFDTTTDGFTVTQPLFDWEIWSRFKQSQATVSRAESEFQQASQDLLLRAAESYFLSLEKEDQLATVNEEKKAMEGHYNLAQKKADAGLGRKVDVKDAEARYLTTVAKEIELESRLIDSRYALKQLTGQYPGTLAGLKDDVVFEPPQPADPDEWVQGALEAKPEVKALEYAKIEAEKEVAARKSGHYPTVELQFTDGTRDTDGSLFGGGSEVETTEIAVNFNMPLFEGGYVSSRVRQAIQDKYRIQEELVELQRSTERDVRDAFQRVVASIAQVNALSRSVDAQSRMLETKTRGFKTGRYALLEVLDAQQDLAHQQQAYTKARYDYALNTLKLKYAAGSLSDDDILRINSWLDPNSVN